MLGIGLISDLALDEAPVCRLLWASQASFGGCAHQEALDKVMMLHQLSVAESERGERLDVVLERRLAGCSRSLVARCVRDGLCRIEPGKAKPGYRLRGGEAIAIEVPELEALAIEPEDLDLTILFEDEDLLIVNKAPDMVVHPAVGHAHGTLLGGVLGYLKADSADEARRPGLIHRLDADTSGVIAVAKHPQALATCQQAFKNRIVSKRYLALVHGRPRTDWLRTEAWLGRDRRDFRRRAVLPEGASGAKSAATSFVVRQRAEGYAVLEARPTTGRTHQIRVHIAHLGHPILADRVYGRSDCWPLGSSEPTLVRQALHAWQLQLPHPRDGRALTFQAPIPEDLAYLVPADLTPLADPG